MDVKLGNTLHKQWTEIGNIYNYHLGKLTPAKQAIPDPFSQPACILEINSKWNFIFRSSSQNPDMFVQISQEKLKQVSYTGKESLILGETDLDESFIMDYALQYKEYKDQIMWSSSGEEQEKLLDALALKFNEAVKKAAYSLSGTFDKFFNYQNQIYEKYLGSSSEKIFDNSKFKDHLMEIANKALAITEQASNRVDAEFQIKDFLENHQAKDASLEQMSFHDLKTLTAYFRKLPVLYFSPDTSLEAITEKWLNATNVLVNSKELSLPIQKKLELTVSRNTVLYKKVYKYLSKDYKCDFQLINDQNKLRAKESEYKKLKEQFQGYFNPPLSEQNRLQRRINKIMNQIKTLKTAIANTKNTKDDNKEIFLQDLEQDKMN